MRAVAAGRGERRRRAGSSLPEVGFRRVEPAKGAGAAHAETDQNVRDQGLAALLQRLLDIRHLYIYIRKALRS
jgi:hypothetical protein